MRSLDTAAASEGDARARFTFNEYKKIFSINSTGSVSSADNVLRRFDGLEAAAHERARLLLLD
jgi:hypothetical protein